MVYPIARIFLAPIFRLFIKKVEGLENIPKKGAFVLAVNHESYLDPFVVAVTIIPVINRKIHFFAKKAGWWNVFGDYISKKWAGCIPVEKSKKSKKKAMTEARDLLGKDKVIGIFPEGTRTLTDKLLKAKTGVARLVIAGAPVIPIGIIGAFQVWPPQNKFPKLKKGIKIKIGRPMYFRPKKINKKILHEIADQIMKEISKLINKKYRW